MPPIARPTIVRLTPTLAVTGALAPEDFAEIARLGFKSVINNRVDGEEPGQLSGLQETRLAARAGLAYRHLTAAKHEVLDDHVVAPLAEALAAMPGPILLHCRSGLRSTIMWVATLIDGGASLDEALAAAMVSGQDLSALRDELAMRVEARAPAAIGPAASEHRAAA
jgi:uncharacterized protein (TIGR01244 family)